MALPSSLPEALDAELDDALGLLPLIRVVPDLADPIFDRLTGALADGLVHTVVRELSAQHDGPDDATTARAELRRVVAALHASGLLAGRGPSRP